MLIKLSPCGKNLRKIPVVSEVASNLFLNFASNHASPPSADHSVAYYYPRILLYLFKILPDVSPDVNLFLLSQVDRTTGQPFVSSQFSSFSVHLPVPVSARFRASGF